MAAPSGAPRSAPSGMSLGLVETLGLVAAVEAADAMLKAADVRLVRTHRVDPGRISHVVAGETSAVQAAVAAGVAAAERVGTVYGSLVIARPADDVWQAMLGVLPDAAETAEEAEPASDSATEPAESARAGGDSADAPVNLRAGTPASGPPTGPVEATAPPERDYAAMNVQALRALVRDRADIELRGRAVASASKDDLVAGLRAADAR